MQRRAALRIHALEWNAASAVCVENRRKFMQSATDYQDQAAACRRAAKLSKRPVPYLLNLAEHYEQLASRLEAQFAGDKPGTVAARDTDRKGSADKDDAAN
jgi:hypothetical protein